MVMMIGSPDSTLEYHVHYIQVMCNHGGTFWGDGIISASLYSMQFIVSQNEFCGMLITSEFYM